MKVISYDGASWSDVGGSLSASSTSNISVAAYNSVPYAAYCESADGNKIYVKSFSSPAWETLGSPIYVTTQANNIKLTTDGTTTYVSYTESSDKSVQVYKYTQASGVWMSIVNGNIANTQYSSSSYLYNGSLYVMYSSASQGYKPSVKSYSDNLSIWTDVGTPGFGAEQAVSTYRSIFVENENSIYAAYQVFNGGNYNAVAMHYNGSAWSQIGTGYLTPGASSFLYIVTAAGIPYFMALDMTDYKTYVKSFR